jgi:acyl-CoA reductase-like NAD-dependent aldehyde dehydrogenase
MCQTLAYIKAGIDQGATLVVGGKQILGGRFIEPTVFVDVTNSMTIAREEIFGPVMCIMKFTKLEDAVEYANDSSYGLWANVFTENLSTALYLSKRIRAGTVTVNCNHYKPQLPFGGVKESGFGREGGIEAIEDFTQIKVVIIPGPS